MRKTLLIAALALAASLEPLMAQQKATVDELYLTPEEVPNAVLWLPAPPEPGSTQITHDINQYYWGKAQRLDSARAQKAIREAEYRVKQMAEQFSEAFGMAISETATPAIFRVLNRSVLTIRLSASKPKQTYMRLRQYVRFQVPTLVPAEEPGLRYTGSYPSGHTVRGWGMALLLSEINPDRQDELFRLGYEWGQSRVIAGFHWQSDVDASRMLAAATYARLHACQAFLDDMAAARREFQQLSAAARK